MGGMIDAVVILCLEHYPISVLCILRCVSFIKATSFCLQACLLKMHNTSMICISTERVK